MTRTRRQDLRRYAEGFHEIEGWLERPMASVIAALDEEQRRRGVVGDFVDVGVHNGRVAVLWLLLSRKAERVIAVDWFQGASATGPSPEHEAFRRNVDRFAAPFRDRLTVLRRDSRDLTAEDYQTLLGEDGARLFSIDGTHTAEATRIDLDNALAVLTQGGIVLVDDYFNQHWPGVSEAVGRLFFERTPRIRPFLVGWQKVLFCDVSHAEAYRAAVADAVAPPLRVSESFGAPVSVYPMATAETIDRIRSISSSFTWRDPLMEDGEGRGPARGKGVEGTR